MLSRLALYLEFLLSGALLACLFIDPDGVVRIWMAS